ncbi:hypothetical protein DFS33DRAFT_1111545 [Desarmillaria ectypa]|nr:hypothetical protein DFS33DRAFT_1111545 [Desarmillaria ectypa]
MRGSAEVPTTSCLPSHHATEESHNDESAFSIAKRFKLAELLLRKYKPILEEVQRPLERDLAIAQLILLNETTDEEDIDEGVYECTFLQAELEIFRNKLLRVFFFLVETMVEAVQRHSRFRHPYSLGAQELHPGRKGIHLRTNPALAENSVGLRIFHYPLNPPTFLRVFGSNRNNLEDPLRRSVFLPRLEPSGNTVHRSRVQVS